METKCLFCGSNVQLVFVHGHYQCPVCKTNALPCCDGDSCNNAFLSPATEKLQESNTGDIPPKEN